MLMVRMISPSGNMSVTVSGFRTTVNLSWKSSREFSQAAKFLKVVELVWPVKMLIKHLSTTRKHTYQFFCIEIVSVLVDFQRGFVILSFFPLSNQRQSQTVYSKYAGLTLNTV